MEEQRRTYEHPGEAHVTRIKRKAIEDAIVKINTNRPSITWAGDILTPSAEKKSTQQGSPFLKIPGEIRNIIYRYALDINIIQERVPRHGFDCTPRADGFVLFETCRQIAAEARSMFEAEVSIYIPVEGAMDFGLLVDWINNHDASRLLLVQNTILVALSTSMKVHIHLHAMWRTTDIDLDIIRLDPTTALVLGRLRQAILVFISQSAALSQLHGGRKRKGIVHLDHLLSDWLEMRALVGPWKLSDIMCIMGKDKNTEWEIRAYVWTGNRLQGDLFGDLAIGAEGVQELIELSAKYDNIKIVAEVSGDLVWSCEKQ